MFWPHLFETIFFSWRHVISAQESRFTVVIDDGYQVKNGFAINRNPRMTKFLVAAGAFRSEPVVILDIGARGGAGEEWKVFEDQVRLYCFEPDEGEHQRLASQAPANTTYIRAAIGGVSDQSTFYETR